MQPDDIKAWKANQRKELLAKRLAPCNPVQAVSPTA